MPRPHISEILSQRGQGQSGELDTLSPQGLTNLRQEFFLKSIVLQTLIQADVSREPYLRNGNPFKLPDGSTLKLKDFWERWGRMLNQQNQPISIEAQQLFPDNKESFVLTVSHRGNVANEMPFGILVHRFTPEEREAMYQKYQGPYFLHTIQFVPLNINENKQTVVLPGVAFAMRLDKREESTLSIAAETENLANFFLTYKDLKIKENHILTVSRFAVLPELQGKYDSLPFFFSNLSKAFSQKDINSTYSRLTQTCNNIRKAIQTAS